MAISVFSGDIVCSKYEGNNGESVEQEVKCCHEVKGKCENVGPAVIAKRRLGGLNIGNVTKIF